VLDFAFGPGREDTLKVFNAVLVVVVAAAVAAFVLTERIDLDF